MYTTPTVSQDIARELIARASGQRPRMNSESATFPARKLP